jgi:hypothetical protein
VEAGTDITLKVNVACPSGCDLRGRSVRVAAPTGDVLQIELVGFADMRNQTEEFVLKAPQQVGEYAWGILFPRHESEGVVHEESCLTIFSTATAHPTSIAVWDVPSPVVVSSSFKVKVGMKCSVACQLTGKPIVLRDEAGIKVGEGRLGETPWPGTNALYWAEVNLAAPAREGMCSWTAMFSVVESEMPHREASATFSFRTAKPAEHRVTVTVTDRDTEAPLENVQVRLGFYRASTDERGQASLEVPRGRYDLYTWKVGYETHSKTVEVTDAVTIQVKALSAPDKDPDDEQVWM